MTQIQQLVKGLKKVDDRVAECSQGTSEVKEENETKDKLGNTNGDETQKSNPIDHITPSQFNDANEIRRAISLNNISISFKLMVLKSIQVVDFLAKKSTTA